MKAKIKFSGAIIEVEPLSKESLTKKYQWMDKVSGVFYKDEELEIIQEDTNNEICKGLIKELNLLLEKYNCDYTEDLHEAIINTFDNIAETEYRKYLGKII